MRPTASPLRTLTAQAVRTGLPPKRLRRAIHDRQLRAYRAGRWWRLRDEDVDGWVETLLYEPNVNLAKNDTLECSVASDLNEAPSDQQPEAPA